MIEDYYRDFLAAEKAAVELPAETKNKINSINKNTPNTIDVETFGELINDVLLVRDSFRKVYKPDMQKEIVDELLKLDRLVSKIENKLREHLS